MRRAVLTPRSSRVASGSSSSSRLYACCNRISSFLILLATLCIGFQLGLLIPQLLTRQTDNTLPSASTTDTPHHSHRLMHHSLNQIVRSSFTTQQQQPQTINISSSIPVQSLNSNWQSTWLTGPNHTTTYRTIANATCLLYHKTAERPQCILPSTNDDLITEMNVVWTICGETVRELAITSMKSFILHRHSTTKLHIWLLLSPYDTQRQYITDTMARWPSEFQPYPINNETVSEANSSVIIHFLNMDTLMEKQSNSSTILQRAKPFLGLFKQCATTRLWLPQLLPPTLGLVLYVDCDTLVVRDYRQMFSHAQLYSDTQFISFAYEGTSKQCGSWYFLFPLPAAEAPSPYAINSGVMLINLTRIHSRPSLTVRYSESLLSIISSGGRLDMGDQDVYNRWIGINQHSGRDFFFPFPMSYNWRECSFVPPGEVGGLTLLHGNAYKFFNVKEEAFWGSTYQSYYLWPKLPSNPTMKIKEDGK